MNQPRELDVLVVAPYGRDAPVAARVLQDWDITTREYHDIGAMCAGLADGAGAILVTEEAITANAGAALVDEIQTQPSWSDIPIVILTAGGNAARPMSGTLKRLAERTSVTILDRPVRLATMVTTLRSALRARQRQYDVRDYIERQANTERVLRDNERNLHEARLQAEEANLAKTRFLATMSHELRTPLNAIAGYTEIMAMEVHGPITPEQRADLSRIERSQRYLLSLINDVLNYSKIEAGHVAFAVHSFRVDPLLRALEAFVAPQLAAKNIRYEYVSKAPNCTVMADEEKTQQILLNLLSNAVKFTPANGAITVTCSTNDGHVVVAVQDTGPGIPMEKQEAVFEPFVQLDRGLTSSLMGTGLGLSISRDLARKMGGDLTVVSQEDAGSTFTLTLPRTKARGNGNHKSDAPG